MKKYAISLVIGMALAGMMTGGFLRLINDAAAPGLGGRILMENSPSSDISRPAEKFPVAGGVVPHHILAKEIIRSFFACIAEKTVPETIVILSPDHFNAASIVGQTFIGLAASTGEFNGFAVDKVLSKKLNGKVKIIPADSFISVEHGITVFPPYIKEYFPAAKILPILIPAGTAKNDLEDFVKVIDSQASPGTIVVASTDFSHYLPESAAALHDVKSIAALINLKGDEFKKLEVDCWQCLYAARLFSKLRGKEMPEIVAHKNSVDFLGLKDLEETTSYFSVVFKEGTISRAEEFGGKTILFVGDVMLDRAVESLMEKNGSFYPFEKMKQMLKGIDIVFGNLEGPVMKDPENFPPDSLKFNFAADIAKILSSTGFDLLGLANNHTLDGGSEALGETRELLKNSGIDSAGDPVKCATESVIQKDNLTFIAVNRTYAFGCSDEEIVKLIKSTRNAGAGNFIIASPHWGEEYQPGASLAQQNLAHQMIDAGANVILGHHPHVVQNVEIYKGKLIFYSLGNFVFDQYFSEETQKGLVVGLEIYPEKLVFRLFPIQSRSSQPYLMEPAETRIFLENLAKRSEPDLSGKIKNGIIEIAK